MFVFYPLWNYSVDGTGMASAFAPNIILALAVFNHHPLPAGVRIVGSCLGGVVGGKLMQWYFPDDKVNGQ